MLSYLRTSILESQAQTIVNTINTVGVMGKGLALAMGNRYPAMASAYKKLCQTGEIDIGKLWLWKESEQWVLNFPTKKHWRNPSKLEYVSAGLEKFVNEYDRRGIYEISFPRLGCGNGGLDWVDVKPMMENYLGPLPIAVFIHDFEKDIGLPEHEEFRRYFPEENIGSYPQFISDVKKLIYLSKGEFQTLTNNTPFQAKIDVDGSLVIERNGRRSTIPEENLGDLWSMLVRGPVSRTKLAGPVQENAYWVFAILSRLPYAKAVQVEPRGGTPSIAVSFDKPKKKEQIGISNERVLL